MAAPASIAPEVLEHPLSIQLARPRPWLRWLAVATVAATYLLIVIGGVVRASGSGLGCPDWPLCHGQALPPAQTSSVIEFSHRAMGGIVSVLIASTLVAWGRARAWDRRAVIASAAILLLLATQIVLGAVTVALELPPMVVLAHLGLAMLLLGGLVLVAVQVWQADDHADQPGASAAFSRMTIAGACAVYVLVLSGALVRASGASWACVGFPGCNGEALPFGANRLVDIQLLHRLLAYAVAAHLVVVMVRAWRAERSVPGVLAAALAVGVALVAQVAIGAAMVSTGVPPLAQALHVAGAAGLWTSIVALAGLATIAAPLGVTSNSLVHAAAARPAKPAVWETIGAYVSLTKPRVVSLLLVTTFAAMVIAAEGMPPLHLVVFTLLGGALGAGGANAINCWLDRDIDAVMHRTVWRAIPSGVLRPENALRFGVILGIASFVVLAAFVNLLAALLTMAALLFYVLIYTRWLKRASPQNIVIGGAAGAVPPLVGWAAVTGELSLLALYLFAIVFYWTPPHFWALSLLIKEDYRRAGVPMLPVVRGDRETHRQIVLYSVMLVALTAVVYGAGLLGAVYLASALALGCVLIWYAIRLQREGTQAAARRMFKFSMLYLALLFCAMALDRVL